MPLGLALGLGLAGLPERRLSAVGYSMEAAQFFARISDPGTIRKNLYAALIDALVEAGVWAKLDALYVFAAADQATALTSLISATYNAVVINSPTFTADQGFTGAVAKYIYTYFNPTTASSPKFTRNDATIQGWSLTPDGIVGALVGFAATTFFIAPRWTNDFAFYLLNNSTIVSIASVDGSGCHLLTRRTSTSMEIYKNGVSIGTTAEVSTDIQDQPITYLLGGGGNYSGIIAAGLIGSQLSAAEQLALYNAEHTYLQAVAGVA